MSCPSPAAADSGPSPCPLLACFSLSPEALGASVGVAQAQAGKSGLFGGPQAVATFRVWLETRGGSLGQGEGPEGGVRLL